MTWGGAFLLTEAISDHVRAGMESRQNLHDPDYHHPRAQPLTLI